MDGRPGPGTFILTSGSWWPVGGKPGSLGVGKSSCPWPPAWRPPLQPTCIDPGGEMGPECLQSSSGGRSHFQKLLGLLRLCKHLPPCSVFISSSVLSVPNPGRSDGTGDFPFWFHERNTLALPRNQTESPGWLSLSCLHKGVILTTEEVMSSQTKAASDEVQVERAPCGRGYGSTTTGLRRAFGLGTHWQNGHSAAAREEWCPHRMFSGIFLAVLFPSFS